MKNQRGLPFVVSVAAAVSLAVLLLARGFQLGFEAMGWQIEPSSSYVASALVLTVIGAVWHLGTREEDNDDD